jgi:hypothetical protein
MDALVAAVQRETIPMHLEPYGQLGNRQQRRRLQLVKDVASSLLREHVNIKVCVRVRVGVRVRVRVRVRVTEVYLTVTLTRTLTLNHRLTVWGS